MRIAYATTYDASEVRHWSGTGYFTAKALRDQGCDLDMIGPLPPRPTAWPVAKAKGLVYNRLLRKRYHPGHDIRNARHFANEIRRRLSRRPAADVIFSPGAVPVAFLECESPVAFWSDATHAGLFDFYPEYSHLCTETRHDGHAIEKAALGRCAAAIFSSDWAAQSAICDYGADPSRIHVVPFGANLVNPPSRSQITEAIKNRDARTCRLLHVGVDWERKGGPLALQVAAELNRIGLPAELRIVGCNPFGDEPPPPYVRCEGFLDKQNPSDRARLEQLYADSHFLIVPSTSECYGLVYCEANAFGVPSLARNVGGVPTIIRENINGHLFAPDAPAAEYVRTIDSSFSNSRRYRDLACSSREQFDSRLNWNVAGKRVREILEGIVDRQRCHSDAVLPGHRV